MKVVTAKEMQDIDRRTIEDCGITVPVLMERAGTEVAARIVDEFPTGKVLVLAGSGNNGGDGIVVGRELHRRGWRVKVLLLLKEDKLSPDCLSQYRAASKLGVPIQFGTRLEPGDLHASLVVDAIFGTGLTRDVKGTIAGIIEKINQSDCPVIAVDIPSGISGDTGAVLGTAVFADMTVAFGAPKRGHFLYPGAEHTGVLSVADIGFPPEFFDDVPCSLIEKEDMRVLLPARPAYSHKGDFGHVFVVAGSRGKTGAALMAARAALRAGAGMVTLGVAESLMDVFQTRVTEEMCLPLPDKDGAVSDKAAQAVTGFINDHKAVLAIGPGLGTSPGTVKLVQEVISTIEAPAVVDADAVNALAKDIKVLKRAWPGLVLTPHPGEFSRLSGKKKQDIESDRIEAALGAAGDFEATLLLKGAPTIIATLDGRSFINPTGTPALAKAGSGDVLTGLIAALLAQGLEPPDAASLGAYLHGNAGRLAACGLGERSVLASDVIRYLPDAIKALEDECGT